MPQSRIKSTKEAETTAVDNGTTYAAHTEELYGKPYIMKRLITVKPVKHISLYRQVNDRVMPKRVEYIGSSVRSSQILSSNKGEVEAYFPMLLGMSPNNENFVTRLKQYLNNIQVRIDSLGVTFDASFHFNKLSDFNAYREERNKIEREYSDMPKGDMSEFKKRLNSKILAINNLESSLYMVGSPVNLADYIMYRHCLLYSNVAKDMSLINSDPNIRLYIVDESKEEEMQAKRRQAINAAKRNYILVIGDDQLFESVYIQYCVYNNIAIINALSEDRINREAQLDRFSQQEPAKFNAICTDKDVKIRSLIEMLIARGELVRSQYNQNITTSGGEFIGANMKEAVVWFKNPNNEEIVAGFKNKLKFFA